MFATDLIAAAPPAPTTVADTGLNEDLVLQLVAKTMLLTGEMPGIELAERLGVRFSVIEPALGLLKRDRFCEITGGGLVGSPTYRYRLTDAGRVRASLFLDQNHYVGPAPVPLDQYRRYLKRYATEDSTVVTRQAIRRAFTHLVLSDRVLDQLGPAITARHSLFIYGPPGNGKTIIAKAIRNLLVGSIAIPHAVAVDGHVMRLFDPANHEALPDTASDSRGYDDNGEDKRWVRCRRPLVIAGGELTLDALELGQSGRGMYRAPLQALANGGVLILDDFGRQHAKPIDLLNRWIVPLESRVDYLTLETGQKFEMPFDTLLVFATNLRPSELVDEAFLRRIRYKVFAESPTPEQFGLIFERCCQERDLKFDPALIDALIASEIGPRGVALRGCQPRDLIEDALSLAAYLGRPRELTLDLLESACATYFVDDGASAPSPAR